MIQVRTSYRVLGTLPYKLCGPENCSPVLIIRTTFLHAHAFRQLITKMKFIFMDICTRIGYESPLTGFLRSFSAVRTSYRIRRNMKVADRACWFVWASSSSVRACWFMWTSSSSVTVREEREIRTSENRDSRRIFERKGQKNT